MQPLPSPPTHHAASSMFAFFRYHGIWAPGVRAFRRLSFRAKALMISLAFVVPLAVLGASFVQHRLAQVRATALERDGVAYIRETLALMRKAQAYRSLAMREVAKLSAEGLAQARSELDTQFTRLGERDAAVGSALGSSAAYNAAREASKKLAPAAEGLFKTVMEIST